MHKTGSVTLVVIYFPEGVYRLNVLFIAFCQGRRMDYKGILHGSVLWKCVFTGSQFEILYTDIPISAYNYYLFRAAMIQLLRMA